MLRPLPLSLAAALLLASPGARAESDTERAGNEFQAAHRLFKDGDYEAALRRYEAAYGLAPHPNILYNLALTHERLLRYDDAIAAFERYLAAPPSRDPAERPLKLLAERSLRRLRALPAQLSVSAVPEQVEVSISPEPPGAGTAPAGARFEGRTPAVFKVPAGRYRLRYRHAGYFDEEVAIEAHVGQALLVQRQLRYRPRPLAIVSSPAARIFLDDRPIGDTPHSGTVDVGNHRLRLERRFYLPYVTQLSVSPARSPVRYRVQLEQNGRPELLAGAALAGAGLGLVALRTIKQVSVEETRDEDVYQPLFAALLPAALGAGIVLLAGDKVPASSAQMFIGNASWGALMGLGLGFGIDPTGLLPHWLAAGSGILGATVGLGIDRWLHPRSGTVALYNSGATWGATIGALTWAYLLAHGQSGSFIGDIEGASGGSGGWALLAGTAAGVSLGAVLATLRPLSHLSRQHVAMIDLGGLVGGLGAGVAGLGISYGVTQSWQGAGRVGILSAMGGVAAGLLGAALLTRSYRADRATGLPRGAAPLRLEAPGLAIAPQPGGFGAELTLLRGLW